MEETVLTEALKPHLLQFNVEEREYLEKRKNKDAFAEGLLARSLLLYGLKMEYNLTFLPRIAREEGGKPFFPDYPGICFSLSHSGGRGAAAIAGGTVGVDIQTHIHWKDSLVKKILHVRERELLETVRNKFSEWEAELSLTSLWCLKEAYVKYTGEGLRHPLKKLDFSSVIEGRKTDFQGLFCQLIQRKEYSAALIQSEAPRQPVYVREKELQLF